MTFNKQQMEILSAWEDNFRTAVNSKWSRGIGTTGYVTIHKIYTEATGRKFPMHPSCGSCMLRLLQEVGGLYFADKQELIDAQNHSHAVEMTEQEMKTSKAVVKTKKRRTTKKAQE